MNITQTVNLWLCNDQSLYLSTVEAVMQSEDLYDLTQAIRELVEQDLTFQDGGTLHNDLLISALSDVDWRSIAQDFWSDFRDEDAA